MTLDETINEAKITAVIYEREARKCIRHGGSFYEEKAKAFRESAKEFEQVTEWLEELKAYREAHGTADRPQEWIDKAISIIDDMQREGIIDYEQAREFRMRARMKGADDE